MLGSRPPLSLGPMSPPVPHLGIAGCLCLDGPIMQLQADGTGSELGARKILLALMAPSELKTDP